MVNSPLGIGEHELPQLEITQNDALFVAARHHLAHLAEQASCFVLAQSFVVADVLMKVTLCVESI